MDRYFFEPALGHGLLHNPISSIVGPRPIGWISTLSVDGVLNLAPYSFFGIFSYSPPIVAFSSNRLKDSLTHAVERGEFVVNVVSEELAAAMNLTSTESAVDEFELAGLASAASERMATPRVARTPVALECRVLTHFRLHDVNNSPIDNWVVLGQVVGVSIDRSLIVDGAFGWGQQETVVRGGGPADYYAIGPKNLFQMKRPPGGSLPPIKLPASTIGALGSREVTTDLSLEKWSC
jgi:flavin reductase (DIM6/NTAB) family NADH-FMN oxidoreductase RutF